MVRTITGCPLSTPVHVVMTETGLMPVAARRAVLEAKLLAKAYVLIEMTRSGQPRRRRDDTG